MKRHIFISATGVALAALVAPFVIRLAVAEEEQPRQTMGEIYGAIRVVLPPSLSEARFADPSRHAVILAALRELERGGEHLASHGRTREAGFSFLSRSLAEDTRDIRARFEAGRTEQARFLLHELTGTCAACHSRLPAAVSSSLPRGLISREEIRALPLDERARLEVATRQFEQAAATYEELFRSLSGEASFLGIDAHLESYLELCIRVLRDFERPRAALEQLAARGTPPFLRREVPIWIEALGRVEGVAPEAGPVERATRLVEQAEARRERDGWVEYFAASGLLNSYLEANEVRGVEAAEIYYELGLIESRVGRSFRLSQTESYLEASIRAEPGSAHARRSFALLEDYVIAGYSGSAGTHLPPEERERLKTLEALIRPAPGAASGSAD